MKINIEDIGPVICLYKGIDNNALADANLPVQFHPCSYPSISDRAEQKNWRTFTNDWCDVEYVTHKKNKQHLESMNYVFANRSKNDKEAYLLTIQEMIAEHKHKDKSLCALFKN